MAIKASGFMGKSAISVHLDFSLDPVKFSCLKLPVSASKPLVVLSVALSPPARTVVSPPVGYRKNVGICLVSPCRKVVSFFFPLIALFDKQLDLELMWLKIENGFGFADFYGIKDSRSRYMADASGKSSVSLLWLQKGLIVALWFLFQSSLVALESLGLIKKTHLLCSSLRDKVPIFIAKRGA